MKNMFDRSGSVVVIPGPLAVYSDPRFSPDGKSIAVAVRTPRSGKNDVWVYPVAGGQPTRDHIRTRCLLGDVSPDGKEIAYSVIENGGFSIRRRSLDGRQPEEISIATRGQGLATPLIWSPDGKYFSLNMHTKERSTLFGFCHWPAIISRFVRR